MWVKSIIGQPVGSTPNVVKKYSFPCGFKFRGEPQSHENKKLHSIKISSFTVFWGYFRTFIAKIKISCKNKTSGMKV